MHQSRLRVAGRSLETAADGLLDVFVYGTLKQGHANHKRFCRGVLSIRPATARGFLYDLPFGFPGLVVLRENILATGTKDYEADARRQRHVSETAFLAGEAVVHGELLTFDDPVERLPALDGLEGYAPGETSLYERVLIPVEVKGNASLAWAYALTRPAGTRIPAGRWTG